MRRLPKRDGFTLAEMMAYIGVLAIIMCVAWVFYYAMARQSHSARSNVEDIIRVVHAGEKWRADVRSATAPPRLVNGVLHVPREGGETLYRFAAGQVERKKPGGEWEAFLLRVAASSMLADAGRHVTSWRWEIELATRVRRPLRPLFTFRAAR